MPKTWKHFYRNYLPHLNVPGATYFVTFRLGDALPAHLAEALHRTFEQEKQLIKEKYPHRHIHRIYQAQKRFFVQYDQVLDKAGFGACLLGKYEIAACLENTLFSLHRDLYELLAYSIMPNHVHLLIDTRIQLQRHEGDLHAYQPLWRIMKRIKGSSSRAINQQLNRTGPLWQKDSYDHLVRDPREHQRIAHYILQNPVKAGLAPSWEDHPFTRLLSRE